MSYSGGWNWERIERRRRMRAAFAMTHRSALGRVRTFTKGQPIVWQALPWGYGYEDGRVPARVIAFTHSRLTVRLRDVTGHTHVRHVAPDRCDWATVEAK